MDQHIKIFISSAPSDREYLKRIKKHLSSLVRKESLKIWDESQVLPGQEFSLEIEENLENSDIALLLLSADYMHSDFNYDIIIPKSISLHLENKLTTFPVIIKPVDWEDSPLGNLAALPRGGKAISTWESHDEAFLNITKSIKSAVESLKEARSNHSNSSKPSPILDNSNNSVETSRGISIGEIFKTAGVPKYTFVPPSEYERLKDELLTLGTGLAIEGPSGIGKTSLVKSTLQELDKEFTWLRGTSDQDVETLESITNRSLDNLGFNYLLIDDFHHIKFEIRKKIAAKIKEIVDSSIQAKVVVIGINQVGYSLMADFGELSGRIGILSIGKQSDGVISKVIKKGEDIANITFRRKKEIVVAANGSYFTAQLLCYHLAHLAKVNTSQRLETTINYGPQDVMDNVLRTLEFKYQKPLHKLATIDAERDIRGAGFVILWLFNKDKSGFVRLDEAVAQYPKLRPSFNWLDDGELKREFSTNQKLSSIFHYDERVKMLAIEDPQLEFYLENQNWGEFARKTGHTISITPDGDLRVHIQVSIWKKLSLWVGSSETKEINRDEQWWKMAGIIGVGVAILIVILYSIPKDWFILKIAIVTAIVVTIFIGLRNPKTRFLRIFWSVFGLFSVSHFLPALGIEASGPESWIRIVTEGPGPVFNIVIGVILVVLLAFDRNEQAQSKSATRGNQS